MSQKDLRRLASTVEPKNQDQAVLLDLKFVNPHVYKQFSDDLAQSATWRLWIHASINEKVIRNCHDIKESAHGGFVKRSKSKKILLLD